MSSVVLVVLWAFAQDNGNAVSSGDAGQWEYAVPTSGPGGSDPMWATQASGPYLNDATDHLELNLPDLSGTGAPV